MKHKLLKTFFNSLYHFFSLFYKSKEKKVVFCSNRSQTLSGNLTNLKNEFEQDKTFKIKVQTFNFKRNLIGRFIYFFQSVQSMYELATADLFIIDDYFLPIYFVDNKLERNKVVQVWHAIGHLKKYGLSIEKNRQSMIKHHSNYDFVVANAPGDVPAILSSFDITEDKVHVLGAPRLDDLVKQPVRQQTNEKENIFMYAPTYRDATNEDSVYHYIDNLIKKFIEFASKSEDYLYISLHPYLKIEKIDTYGANNINIFKDGNKSSKLLGEIDVLITDYSSIAFDFAYLKKPVIYYHYAKDYHFDLEESYFDYKTMGFGEVVDNHEELIDLIMEYVENECEMKDQYIKRVDDFFEFNDKNNCKRVYDAIKKMDYD